MESSTKPLGIGQILDRSLQIYRKHFVMAFAAVLAVAGPGFFLLQYLVYRISMFSSLETDYTSYGWLDTEPVLRAGTEDALGGFVLLMLFLVPLLLLVFGPPAVSAQLHLTRASLWGQTVRLTQLLRHSFTHFWPAAGNTILFMLMMLGIYLGAIFGVVILFMIVAALTTAFGSGLFDFNFNAFGTSLLFVVIAIVLYLLLVGSVVLLLGYFLIRFGFYLAAIFLDHDRNPFRRSWRLSKGNFWRIFAVWLVITLVFSVFNWQIYALLSLLEQPLLVHALTTVISLLLLPLQMIAYAVTYLDLVNRREGAEVAEMLKRGYGKGAQAESPLSQAYPGAAGASGDWLGDDRYGR